MLAGFGLNYMWEAFRLPGYGVIAYNQPLGVSVTGGNIYLGADDVAQIILGGAVAVAGARTKNATLTGLGVGTAVGVATTKAFETQGVGIIPAACATKVGALPDLAKC
jgi:hypothetical protein